MRSYSWLQNYVASEGFPGLCRNNSYGTKIWCSFWPGSESQEIWSLFPGSLGWLTKVVQGHLFWIHFLFFSLEKLTGVPSDHSQEPAFSGFLLLNPIQNCLSSVLWWKETKTWLFLLNSQHNVKGSRNILKYLCTQETADSSGRIDEVNKHLLNISYM